MPALVGVADAIDPAALSDVLGHATPDLVMTDVPYGQQVTWQGAVPVGEEPLRGLVGSLARVLPHHAVVALAARARKAHLGPDMPAMQRFRVGTRAVLLERAADLRTAS